MMLLNAGEHIAERNDTEAIEKETIERETYNIGTAINIQDSRRGDNKMERQRDRGERQSEETERDRGERQSEETERQRRETVRRCIVEHQETERNREIRREFLCR